MEAMQAKRFHKKAKETMLINEIEHGIGKKISTEVWEHL
jgi:hypothetical protein